MAGKVSGIKQRLPRVSESLVEGGTVKAIHRSIIVIRWVIGCKWGEW